jgi:hypothetical protein
VSEAEADYMPGHVCVTIWDSALSGSHLVDKALALKPRARRCLVAWVFRTCADMMAGLDEGTSKRGVVALWPRLNQKRFRQAAEQFTEESCKEPLTGDQARLLESIRGAIYKNLN